MATGDNNSPQDSEPNDQFRQNLNAKIRTIAIAEREQQNLRVGLRETADEASSRYRATRSAFESAKNELDEFESPTNDASLDLRLEPKECLGFLLEFLKAFSQVNNIDEHRGNARLGDLAEKWCEGHLPDKSPALRLYARAQASLKSPTFVSFIAKLDPSEKTDRIAEVCELLRECLLFGHNGEIESKRQSLNRELAQLMDRHSNPRLGYSQGLAQIAATYESLANLWLSPEHFSRLRRGIVAIEVLVALSLESPQQIAESERDGPVFPNKWRWEGKLLEGNYPEEHYKMLKLVFERKAVYFPEINEWIKGQVNAEAVRYKFKTINTLFRNAGNSQLHFKVTSASGGMVIFTDEHTVRRSKKAKTTKPRRN